MNGSPFAELVRVATRAPLPQRVAALAPVAPANPYRPKGCAAQLVAAIMNADVPLDSPRLAKVIGKPASDVLQILAAAERARLVRRTRNARGFYQWEAA